MRPRPPTTPRCRSSSCPASFQVCITPPWHDHPHPGLEKAGDEINVAGFKLPVYRRGAAVPWKLDNMSRLVTHIMCQSAHRAEETYLIRRRSGYAGEKMALNIFEPRYRLMVRRCMEGSRRLGMAVVTGNDGLHEIATECEIVECQPLPDG